MKLEKRKSCKSCGVAMGFHVSRITKVQWGKVAKWGDRGQREKKEQKGK